MHALALADELVHGRLDSWAVLRGDHVALEDGRTSLSFRDLYRAVNERADALARACAPATVLIARGLPPVQRIVEFLGVVASGRCAAITDPEWPDATREAISASFDNSPASTGAPSADAPFYMGFTSGSTGRPKGFRRSHRSWTESFRSCLATFGPDAASRIAAPGSPSHSLFLFGILHALWCGGGAVLQDRFSAAGLLDTLAREDTPCLVAVPSQLLMLIDLASRRASAPVESVRLVLISGARWMRERTPQLRSLFPRARIIEFYGASETSFITWMRADEHAPPQMVGQPFVGVEIDIRNTQGPDGTGLIYIRSPMVFMDYAAGTSDSTCALRDGEWISVRDMGRLDASGQLHLIGRENRMIVTQGKNLFPEEPESVLVAHHSVLAVSVHGMGHPVRGQEVAAVLRLEPRSCVRADELKAWCRERLEPFKVPRRLFACEDWPQTTGGKTDHQRIGQLLASERFASWFRLLS